MDARMVYPTAPFDTQAQHPNDDAPPAHTGESVESPGKTVGVLSKVKNKAKRLRNRIKKVTGSRKSASGHGDNVDEHGRRDFSGVPGPHDENFDDDEAESNDDEEEEDLHKSDKNEHRYEQLRSIGALDNQGDESEVEVHGGVPVPAMADNTGSYWKRADDTEPISAYKSAGPPDALQATPTEYRHYAADDDIPLEKGGPANRGIEAPLEESGRSGGNLSAISRPEFKPDIEASNRTHDEPVEPHSKYDVSNVSVSGADLTHPESLATSNPSAEVSSAPSFDEAPPEETSRYGENLFAMTGPEFKPDIEASNRSYDEPIEPQSKYDVSNVSVSGTDIPHPENLASTNLSGEESSAPSYDKIAVTEEDLSADRKLGVGLPSDEHVESGKGNVLETSVSEFDPEGKRANLLDTELGESQSKDGVLGTGGRSASDIDEPYPGDLVKPNPSFGQSASPTHDKIAVMNEDASPDEKLGLGLSTGEKSGSGKGNLLETAVPEGEELSGFQTGGGSTYPLEADELVYRPVSESEEGSFLTSPPGKLEGVVYGRNTDLQGSETGLNKGISQSDMLSEEDLPTAEVDPTASKAADNITTDFDERKRSSDVALDQPAGEVFDTAGDGSHENWGKWSADKINNAENVTVSSLAASDLRSDGEIQDDSGGKSVDGIGTIDKVPDKVPESKNMDVVGPPVGEDVNQDSEEDYYDPNEVKDDQFEQGFALGYAEEDALSGTLAGSAIETLQGLKDTMQSSLGYSNQDTSDVGGEDRPGPVEGEERTISPSSSQQQQKGGFVQGLGESVASFLGYGKTGPEEVGQDTDVLERVVEPETDFDSRQQQAGGTEQVEEKAHSPSSLQPLSPGSTHAPSLVYGKTGPEEEVGQGTDVLERVVEPETDFDSRQQQAGGTEQVEEKALPPSSSQPLSPGSTHAPSLGYGKTGPEEEVGQGTDVLERVVEPETDFDSRQQQAGGTEQVEEKALSPSSSQPLSHSSSEQQQKGGYFQGLIQTVASPLGYGKAGSSEEVVQNTDALERGRELETDLDSRQQQPHGTGEVEERVLSSSGSQEHKEGGFVQGLSESVASSLGYGKTGPEEEAGQDTDALERAVEPETSRQQQAGGTEKVEEKALSPSSSQPLSPSSSEQQQKGGYFQGLKQAVASSLGYGKAGSSEKVGQNTDALERGRELEPDLDSRQQQPHGTEEVEERVISPSGSQEHKEGGFVDELKETVASPLGYGEAGSDKAGNNNDVLEKGVEQVEKPRSPSSSQQLSSGSSQQQQKGGFVQGLKETVASSLGYGKPVPGEEDGQNIDTLERGRESETDLDSRQQQPIGTEVVEERVLSPSGSQERHEGGFVEELQQKASSPLGHDEAGSDKPGHSNDVLEKGGASESDLDSRMQQSPGTYHALKNAFASKLGYGVASGEQSPTATKEIESREQSAEKERSEIPHNEGGETNESGIKSGLVLNDVKDSAVRGEEVSEPSPRSRGMLQGLKDRFTSTLGYSGQPAETHKDAPHTESEHEPDLERSEIPHDEEGETNENGTKPGLVLNDVKDFAGRGEEIPHNQEGEINERGTKPGLVLNDVKDSAGRGEEIPEPSPRSRGMLQGLKDRFTSTLGYNSQPVETHKGSPHTEPEPEHEHLPVEAHRGSPHTEPEHEPEHEPEPEHLPVDAHRGSPHTEPELEPEPEPVSVSSPGADDPPSSYTQMFMGARNYLSSKVGYGSSNEDVVERSIDDGHKGDKSTSPSPHVDSIHKE